MIDHLLIRFASNNKLISVSYSLWNLFPRHWKREKIASGQQVSGNFSPSYFDLVVD